MAIFGPAVADGYGVCYNIRQHDIMCGVTAYNTSSQTSAQHLGEALDLSLQDVQRIMAAQQSRL